MKAVIIVPLILVSNIFAGVISSTVGQVDGDIVTSREALQSLYIENVLFDKKKVPTDIESKEFARKLNAVLLEEIVYREAVEFRPKHITQKELNNKLAIVRTRLKNNRNWRRLETSKAEIKRIIQKKLVAKDFIQFKASSSVVPVTEQEARTYYEENKSKFGGASFESLHDNIKTFLNRRQVDVRLKSWFDVLRSKYRVKNLIQ